MEPVDACPITNTTSSEAAPTTEPGLKQAIYQDQHSRETEVPHPMTVP